MDAAEAAETIKEAAEEEKLHEGRERFRSRAAMVVAVLAALLAVCDLAGDNAKNSMIDNNIRASDTWAFYQAKNIRQTEYGLAADGLKRALQDPGLSASARGALQGDLGKYQKTAARYEDDPTPGGEGKKQLMARAKGFEEARDKAGERHELFDLAVMVLQLGIVLASVSILALSRPLLWASGMLGAAGLVLLADGIWLLAPIAIHMTKS